jgi:hypothetical protein
MKKQYNGSINSDAGLLSIDFLAGFTIFMIAFIMVVTMVSGLFVGLQSKTIDYDAVAYRTGVILAEDPGECQDTVGATRIAPDHFSWEQIKEEYTQGNFENTVLRMGLSLPRYYYDTPPNVWLEEKSITFFSRYKHGAWSDEFYRDNLVFGDYPYRTNITIRRETGETESIGEPFPENGYYGYIKRVGLIKRPSQITSNLSDNSDPSESPPTTITGRVRTISYDLGNLYLREPAYQVYPLLENTSINFTEIPANTPDPLQIDRIQIYYMNCPQFGPCYPTFEEVLAGEADIIVDGVYKGVPTPGNPVVLNKTGKNIMIIYPTMFNERPGISPIDKFHINVTFNNESVAGIDYYEYGSQQPARLINGSYASMGDIYQEYNLTPAWLEVRVW